MSSLIVSEGPYKGWVIAQKSSVTQKITDLLKSQEILPYGGECDYSLSPRKEDAFPFEHEANLIAVQSYLRENFYLETEVVNLPVYW